MKTIRDVARHADVSVATVSRVINNSGHVSDKLSQRVLTSISTLGFEPDFLARTWRTRITRTIAAVISDNTSPHHGTVLREAAAVALAHDYNMILCTTFHDPEIERRYLRMLRLRSVDGIALNYVSKCDDEIRRLTDAGVPVVLLNRPLGHYGPLVDAVVVDSYKGALDMVNHLISMGHRRIAMIYSDLQDFHKQERLRGYMDALRAHGIPYDDSLVAQNNLGANGCARLLEQVLALPQRPTALFAASYNSAMAAMRTIRSVGLRVPDDLAFGMFDDVAWGEFLAPPLTLVSNPAKELGRAAMELLFARMADHERPPQEVRLQPRLVVRRSCGWQGPVNDFATPTTHQCDKIQLVVDRTNVDVSP